MRDILDEVRRRASDARRNWAQATTDEERQRAAWETLDALILLGQHYVGADEMRPAVQLSGALADLARGKQSGMLKAAPRSKNPGAGTPERLDLGALCAVADALAGHRGGMQQAENYVADRVGMKRGAFRSLRKKVKTGEAGDHAAHVYDVVTKAIAEDGDQQAAAETILADIAGSK